MEAQDIYLQIMLEKDRKTLPRHVNGTDVAESAKAQLPDSSANSLNLMEDLNRHSKDNVLRMSDVYKKTRQIYQEKERLDKNVKVKVEEGSTIFDLNINDSYHPFSERPTKVDLKLVV